MLVAGALAGMAWAAIPAFLRNRFHTNEILVSLMLVYVAQLLLSYLVHGPWRDPAGYNFPQSKAFGDAELLPILIEGTRVNVSFVIALVLAVAIWIFSQKTFAGFRHAGRGSRARRGGVRGLQREAEHLARLMLIGGGCAGLAGISEVAGPIGQLQSTISPGYGFAAIIVAWVGRLHPLGVVLGGLLMSLLYLGGEAAQMQLSLPSAVTGLFQGVLLFYLLAADLFIGFRLRWIPCDAGGRSARGGRRARRVNTLLAILASTVVAADAADLRGARRDGRREGGRAEPRRRRDDAGRRGRRLRDRHDTGSLAIAFAAAAVAGMGAALIFAVADADAADEPGRDRPRADAVRRRLLGVRRPQLRRHADRRAGTGVDPGPERPAGRRPAAVPLRRDGLRVARAARRACSGSSGRATRG